MPAITVPAEISKFPMVLDFLHEQLHGSSCTKKTAYHLDLAMEEMFVNVASYAYGSAGGQVQIICEVEDQGIAVTLIDSGTPFNPLAQPDANITLAAEERDVGGLGILLTKKFMDELHYERRDEKNILSFYKASFFVLFIQCLLIHHFQAERRL